MTGGMKIQRPDPGKVGRSMFSRGSNRKMTGGR